MATNKCKVTLLTLALMLVGMMVDRVASQDYGDALSKCILFFEGQRSGKLPSNQRMNWRKDSALQDGSDVAMDLVGGYFDAGDNVKFNFPMAFSTTMLAWSVIEFGQFMGPELQNALDSIRWGTDYLLKSTNYPGKVTAAVGDPNADHDCWERPEDMDTPRTSYVVNQTHPGSEVSGETAAALAASSLAFQSADKKYSADLINRAKQVFDFADKFRGSYGDSVGSGVCPFYCDYNGYLDELLWAAAWLFKVTNDQTYWNYLEKNIPHLPKRVTRLVDGVLHDGGESFAEFGWDAKYAGINVFVSGMVMNTNKSDPYVPLAEKFVCTLLPDSPSKSVAYSPGGLMFKTGGSNLQHSTALSFLLLAYAQYLKNSKKGTVNCGNVDVPVARLEEMAKGQMDYILGKNPLGMSYMVGFGQKFPHRIHHRGSSLPSMAQQPQHIQCKDGTPYFQTKNPNPNLLTGAIVGGPDEKDQFPDDRTNAPESEPTTYINAPFVGILAYFKANPKPSI
ncbi:Glycoside hydrolase, family 9 [Corchorus olitorius]|uniref:Endoglucanase n=1 Tax=Corchorus olitorius TaxID=93759 RepID=A0A1R3JTB2_9ROSI|nr:Glycoside hydrolase, family 9 [Corchorus olitorius]